MKVGFKALENKTYRLKCEFLENFIYYLFIYVFEDL